MALLGRRQLHEIIRVPTGPVETRMIAVPRVADETDIQPRFSEHLSPYAQLIC